MAKFTDTTGREWIVDITVSTIRQVKKTLEVNLLAFVEGDLLERLLSDPIVLCDTIYVVCKQQADKENVTDEDFGRAMAGDAIDHATRALLEALVDFFPNRRDRANMRKVLETVNAGIDKVRTRMTEKLDSGEIQQEADKLIEQLLKPANGSSTSAPAKSASTLAP